MVGSRKCKLFPKIHHRETHCEQTKDKQSFLVLYKFQFLFDDNTTLKTFSLNFVYHLRTSIINMVERNEVLLNMSYDNFSNTMTHRHSSYFANIPTRDRALLDISSYEENRRKNYELGMARNELYWNELVKMQDEAFSDNERLLLYLKAKHCAFQSFVDSIESIKAGQYYKGHMNSQISDETSSLNSLGPGHRATLELENLDNVWARRISGVLECMENDIIKPYEKFTHEFFDEVTLMRRYLLTSYTIHKILSFLLFVMLISYFITGDVLICSMQCV